ncbi:MAG: hypothetical protein KJ950_13285 [Proteobacteria bacterium]|nr:hypothetical protein [Pseudomonadota bacterium]MBU1686152.1 hypothetical protein [Pseudomonadota bacterium]
MKIAPMIMSVGLSMVLLLPGPSPVCSAETTDKKPSLAEIKRESRELLQAFKAYTAEQRDEALRETKAALDTLDQRIDELEEHIEKNWESMSQTARVEARATLKVLRRQRTQVAEWYGSLKSGSVEAWSQIKKGFSEAYGEFYDAWEKTEKQYGDDK